MVSQTRTYPRGYTCHKQATATATEATHKLDGDLLVVQQVGALEDDTEGALADLLPDPVVDAHDVGR